MNSEKERLWHIDFVRALSIIGVIATHVLSDNLATKTNYLIWNYLHFVVVAFVFCSGYVLFWRYQNFSFNLPGILKWYKKRFLRLIIPFYIYLITHFSLWILLPNLFSGLDLKKTPAFILQSVFFTGGVNLNWLPLLFLQLTILFPLFITILNKKKLLFAYIIFSAGVTIFFTVKIFPYAFYRYVMWISWSLILLFSMYISLKEKLENNILKAIKRYISIGILSFLTFAFVFVLWKNTNKSLTLINHKYPPDFYYLSYATLMSSLVLVISRLSILKQNLIKSIYTFISKNSYQLFFIHYIALDAVLTLNKKSVHKIDASLQFIIVILASLAVCLVLDYIQKLRGKSTKS